MRFTPYSLHRASYTVRPVPLRMCRALDTMCREPHTVRAAPLPLFSPAQRDKPMALPMDRRGCCLGGILTNDDTL